VYFGAFAYMHSSNLSRNKAGSYENWVVLLRSRVLSPSYEHI